MGAPRFRQLRLDYGDHPDNPFTAALETDARMSVVLHTRSLLRLDPTALRVHEGRAVDGELARGQRAGAGTMRGRERVLSLSGGFRLSWCDSSKVAEGSAGRFRYLLRVWPQPSLPVESRPGLRRRLSASLVPWIDSPCPSAELP
jgi:hypothetical protein